MKRLPRIPRPRLRTLLLFLLLLVAGAAVNVAVAWGCGLKSRSGLVSGVKALSPNLPIIDGDWIRVSEIELSQENGLERVDCSDVFMYAESANPADFRGFASDIRLVAPHWMPAHDLNAWGTKAWPGGSVFLAQGWPNLAFWNHEFDPNTQYRMKWFFAFEIIWPGFAINTVFYAGACWLLFAAPFAVRRRLRLRRGQCSHCAYPIGTSELCTECGKPVTAPGPASARNPQSTPG